MVHSKYRENVLLVVCAADNSIAPLLMGPPLGWDQNVTVAATYYRKRFHQEYASALALAAFLPTRTATHNIGALCAQGTN